MTMRFFLLVAISFTIAQSVVGQSSQLDRFELLSFRDNDGRIKSVTNATEWEQRRTSIVQAMTQVMGSPPATGTDLDLNPQIDEEVVVGNYVRRLITYQTDIDCRTPAYMCIPNDVLAGKRRTPAVLCLHPTDNKVGHKVVMGLGGRAGRQYGAELAERGFVTLSPAYPQLANYWPNLGKSGYVSGTMKAIYDNARGIDLLSSMDFVDMSHGVGAIGHSLGGHNAIYSAVFDKRITVVASSCGFDSYRDYMDGNPEVWKFGKGWCSTRYMPLMSNFRGNLEDIPFDFSELLGAIAPRPVFVNAPLGDTNFRWKSVDKCVAAAEPVYRLLEAEAGIRVEHPDCDHNFPIEMREAAYNLISSVLTPR